MVLFKEDPIEYIRKQEDFTETLFLPKANVLDLLQHICSYAPKQKGKKKSAVAPEFLFPFLAYVAQNLREYSEKTAAGQNADWRIKEALLHSVGMIKDEVEKFDEL